MQPKRRMLMFVGFFALSFLAVSSSQAGEWKFPVGLTYIQGFDNVLSVYEDQLGVSTDFSFPFGVDFTPFYQWDHGSRLGMGIGPTALILASTSSNNSSYNADYTYFDLPLTFTYGFSFLPKGSVSPYLRLGARYHIVSGDFVDSTSIGGFGAFGVDFLQKKKVGVEAEVAYDDSTMTMEAVGGIREDVKPGELLISVRVVF